MAHQITRPLTSILLLTVLFQTLAHAQDQVSISQAHPTGPANTWQTAQSRARVGHKIQVVTKAQPTHRIACRVASFAGDQLLCKGAFGETRSYNAQDIAALIFPGDYNQRFPFVIGFNTAAGFATWGAIVLVATCIPCAAATAFAALLFLGAAGASLIADDRPDALLYLAPGQQLKVKGYVSQNDLGL
jgi:hypothetical protein